MLFYGSAHKHCLTESNATTYSVVKLESARV